MNKNLTRNADRHKIRAIKSIYFLQAAWIKDNDRMDNKTKRETEAKAHCGVEVSSLLQSR